MKTKQAKATKTKPKKAKKTTSTKTKKVISDPSQMNVLDGKVNEQEEVRDLEAMINPAGSYNPFKANTDEELETKMSDMSLPELQSLAVETGVFPSGNRTTLKNKLKKEFKSRVFGGKGRVITKTSPIADSSNMTEEQKKLFSI